MNATWSGLAVAASCILLAAAGGTLVNKHPRHFTLILTGTLLTGLAVIGLFASLTEGIK